MIQKSRKINTYEISLLYVICWAEVHPKVNFFTKLLHNLRILFILITHFIFIFTLLYLDVHIKAQDATGNLCVCNHLFTTWAILYCIYWNNIQMGSVKISCRLCRLRKGILFNRISLIQKILSLSILTKNKFDPILSVKL